MAERILIFGGSGLVGSRAVELLDSQYEVVAPTHSQVDVCKVNQVYDFLKSNNPAQVVYLAGFTNVDAAEKEGPEASELNTACPQTIAEIAESFQMPFHYFSTDYVFDGTKTDAPYVEEDPRNPLGFYAVTKKMGEKQILESNRNSSVLRVIMPYRSHFERKLDIPRLTIQRLSAGETMNGIIDQNINPVFTDDICMSLDKILQARATGIYHLGAADYTTPFDFMRKVAERFGLDESLILPTTFEEFSKTRPALRPQHSWIDSSKFRGEFGEDILHTIDQGLDLFKQQLTEK